MAFGITVGQRRLNVTAPARLCTLDQFDSRLWDASVEDESTFQRNRRKSIAIKVCGQCRFQWECRKKAQEDSLLEGVWGGVNFTSKHRKTLIN